MYTCIMLYAIITTTRACLTTSLLLGYWHQHWFKLSFNYYFLFKRFHFEVVFLRSETVSNIYRTYSEWQGLECKRGEVRQMDSQMDHSQPGTGKQGSKHLDGSPWNLVVFEGGNS